MSPCGENFVDKAVLLVQDRVSLRMGLSRRKTEML